MILGESDKPSLEDIQHYGVLGMKWGQRKKYTSTEIKTARKDLRVKNKAYRSEARKVNALKEGSKGRKVGEEKLAKMHKEYLKNPNRIAAIRMTKGEKIASVIFSANPVGLGIAAAAVAGTSIASRRIESKQRSGAYKNVKGRRVAGGIGAPSGGMVALGANITGNMLRFIGPRVVSSITGKAAANNTARLGRTGISSAAEKLKYAKKSRGAFKITTL
jgi:hypothetical protein